MRNSPWLLLLCLLLTGCPRATSDAASADSTKAPREQPTGRMVVVFSATESDPWASELMNTVGAELGFDPWRAADESQHLDTFGPYTGRIGDHLTEVYFILTGLSGISDLTSQQAIGTEVVAWIGQIAPSVVWLDGDQAQFFIGRQLASTVPIMFTGVVADRTAYYTDLAPVTGVYRRHSLPRVIAELWKIDPDAAKFSLVGDSSNVTRTRQAKFKELFDLVLTEDQEVRSAEPVDSWAALHNSLVQLSRDSDAIIITGVGEEGTDQELLTTPAPSDLLEGVSAAVVALGPSAIDHSGVVTVSIEPAAHAQAALETARRLLGGEEPIAIPVVTPEHMAVFRSEKQ